MTATRDAATRCRITARRPLAFALWVAVAAIVAAGLVGLPGCGGDEAALDGTRWRLVRWSESALDPTDFTMTADFEDGRIGGTSAVNSYGGPYSTGAGDEFSIGPLASTMMAGTGEAARAEKVYLELLEAAETFSRRGDTLTLYGAGGGESLVFTMVQPAE